MKVIINRFEGNYAIVEISEGVFEKIPKVLLPNSKENDIVNITILQDETLNRKEKIANLINNVFEDEQL